MTSIGHIHNGVVVLDAQTVLPERIKVLVMVSPPTLTPIEKGPPVQVPLMRTDHPSTVKLTNQQIHNLTEEEEASS